ncbi:hypothetical protein A0O28_0102890 [Trichoderma guizhouense]|uniref:Uncharacterized protein n=1 Tax=Trichoderma guizhouense TaxID=1491466 RepID=A0A1T3CKX1_9HYPO|nr:hypothetical protein A0O28_0102890 [Trichoderma guizhouense]
MVWIVFQTIDVHAEPTTTGKQTVDEVKKVPRLGYSFRLQPSSLLSDRFRKLHITDQVLAMPSECPLLARRREI